MTDLHMLSDPVTDFWKCHKKGLKKVIISTCHTDTTHEVEYGVSHPLTPSSSPVTVLSHTVLYIFLDLVPISKRQKNTETKRQNYRKTKLPPLSRGPKGPPSPVHLYQICPRKYADGTPPQPPPPPPRGYIDSYNSLWKIKSIKFGHIKHF